MIILLGLTAVLGLAMTGLVDNYGHLGGAIVGGAIGLFDRPLLRLAESRWFRAACWASVLGVSTACLGSAIRQDRFESDYRHQFEEVIQSVRTDESILRTLHQLHYLYALEATRPEAGRNPILALDTLAIADLLSRGPRTGEPAMPDPELNNRSPAQLAGVLDRLDHIRGTPWGEAVAADIQRLGALARDSVGAPPRFDQVYEFVVCWISAEKAIATDSARFKARLVELEKAHNRSR
jgi:hypothetical protein